MKLLGRNVCLSLFGTILFSVGVLFLFLWSWLFDLITASMLVLKPNSQTLELWKLPPMPITLDFYFFNWTNPEEIHDLNKKPKFVEMGPYSFKEHREKVNLIWNDNNTVTYSLFRRWDFIEKKSKGKLTDEVTTLNAVTMSAAHHIKDWSYFMKRGFSHTMTAIAPDAHIVRSVGELLFDGYDDPFVNLASTFPFLAESIPQFDKFGWFYGRNNSDEFDGVFNMNTGVSNSLGELRQWNYHNETKFYSGNCAKVHGSAAEFYPSHNTKDSIGFFSPDMCRHVQLDYEKDVNIKGIDGYKYSAQESMLDNGTIIPENKCYCNGQCVPSGAVNVSACRYGTPAFVSLPHFYKADPIYTKMVDGLQPEQSKHELYITLEPKTGLPLDVAVRLQLNIMMAPVEHITLFEEIPTVLFPMLWFEQVATVPDNLSWGLWIITHGSIICPIIASVIIISGLSLIAYVTFQLLIVYTQERFNKQDCCEISRLILEDQRRKR
ncbi:hypothetical protein RN001_011917 [Aquatica leii]|uniref:Uncharacterized protein n=1 Tax=Aquatica leii TaxID=1421715 RepID=A0AAN7Q167_9COLE|nr:hypothetical protein RN001_011917 [Aquatica leii]